jgi:hypothetical protein
MDGLAVTGKMRCRMNRLRQISRVFSSFQAFGIPRRYKSNLIKPLDQKEQFHNDKTD